MRQSLRRLLPTGLWPKTLRWQIVLLLAVALVFANLVALLLLGSERARFNRDARLGAQVERIAALLPALHAIPENLRENVLRASSNRAFRFSMGTTPWVDAGDDSLVARQLIASLHRAVGPLADGARVDIERHGRWRGEGRRFHRARLSVSVPLGDGTWLNVRQQGSDRRPPIVSAAVIFALVLSLVSVLGAALIFVRRITLPLRHLSDAAARAGAGDRNARVPETGAAELRRAAAAFNDMQERIATFDAERARTVAAVGHDLRTPITSLRIRAEMLTPEIRDAMVRTLNEMQVMAEGLLRWGRAEADTEPFIDVDLAALTRELCDPAGGRVAYAGPERAMITGQPVALSRALSNVIGNARRYGNSATVLLAADGDNIIVTVTDDGPGIAPESFDAVFEPFKRLEESRNSETGGSGLGLSIARTVVRAHGGEITLENRTDRKGLKVSIELPRRRDVSP